MDVDESIFSMLSSPAAVSSALSTAPLPWAHLAPESHPRPPGELLNPLPRSLPSSPPATSLIISHLLYIKTTAKARLIISNPVHPHNDTVNYILS